MNARDRKNAVIATSTSDVTERVASRDWAGVSHELDAHGCATIEHLLVPAECTALAALYSNEDLFRSRIVMERHGFGRGEYKYFSYPLPDIVADLRATLYPRLAPIANSWIEAMGIDLRYPARHAEHLERCHAAGQLRPTPLLLRYGPGDYNCLHQDLYGEHVFPLQVAILLSEPGRDFTGGEFVITEQRPRMQSRPEVVPLREGDAVVFAAHHRPVKRLSQGRPKTVALPLGGDAEGVLGHTSTRGVYRVNLRHGVSRVRSGHRCTLGIIFHEAA